MRPNPVNEFGYATKSNACLYNISTNNDRAEKRYSYKTTAGNAPGEG